MNILPIEDEDKVKSPAMGVHNVVIGKSKEQVMEALNMIADEDEEAEEVIDSEVENGDLVHEVKVEHPPQHSTPHAEL